MKYDLKTCADLIFRQINPWFGDGQDHYVRADLRHCAVREHVIDDILM